MNVESYATLKQIMNLSYLFELFYYKIKKLRLVLYI